MSEDLDFGFGLNLGICAASYQRGGCRESGMKRRGIEGRRRGGDAILAA